MQSFGGQKVQINEKSQLSDVKTDECTGPSLVETCYDLSCHVWIYLSGVLMQWRAQRESTERFPQPTDRCRSDFELWF